MATLINRVIYFFVFVFCFSTILLLININLIPTLKITPIPRRAYAQSVPNSEIIESIVVESDEKPIASDDNLESANEEESGQFEQDAEINDRILTKDTLDTLKLILNCDDKKFDYGFRQRGEYWIMYNQAFPDQTTIRCHESITLTTHATYTTLDNIIPLIQRWKNPMSVAVFAPGDDFTPTVNSIDYLRECSGNELVKKYVSFHLFFPSGHMPIVTPGSIEPFDCSLPPPYKSTDSYAKDNQLNYPINLARNIAMESAITHFILASDIELYPSPYIPERFLNLIARDESLSSDQPKVFPLHVFEVDEDERVPKTKTGLVNMINRKKAVQFHRKFCSFCNNAPMINEWLNTNHNGLLGIFNIAKRNDSSVRWEPLFIGTKNEPTFDERIFWEGRNDRMTQAFVMCILNYDYMVLDDAFLVHRPGIKTKPTPGTMVDDTMKMIRETILPELRSLFGEDKSCED